MSSTTMTAPAKTGPAADLVGLVDRFHTLSARVVAAEVEARKASVAADEADELAGAAVVGGDAEAMRTADTKADAAHVTLAKARRDLAALASAKAAALADLEPAVAAEKTALRLAADSLIQACEVKFKAAVAKAAQHHAEAVAIASAVGHSDAGFLAMLTVPASFAMGDPPLMVGQPGQAFPELPKSALALADKAAAVRDAERLLIPAVML